MNNSTARFPEAQSVFSSRAGQKVVHLFVELFGCLEILLCPQLSLDEMVTVDSGWDGYLGQPTADELEHGHLRVGGLIASTMHATHAEAYVHVYHLASHATGTCTLDGLLFTFNSPLIYGQFDSVYTSYIQTSLVKQLSIQCVPVRWRPAWPLCLA